MFTKQELLLMLKLLYIAYEDGGYDLKEYELNNLLGIINNIRELIRYL